MRGGSSAAHASEATAGAACVVVGEVVVRVACLEAERDPLAAEERRAVEPRPRHQHRAQRLGARRAHEQREGGGGARTATPPTLTLTSYSPASVTQKESSYRPLFAAAPRRRSWRRRRRGGRKRHHLGAGISLVAVLVPENQRAATHLARLRLRHVTPAVEAVHDAVRRLRRRRRHRHAVRRPLQGLAAEADPQLVLACHLGRVRDLEGAVSARAHPHLRRCARRDVLESHLRGRRARMGGRARGPRAARARAKARGRERRTHLELLKVRLRRDRIPSKVARRHEQLGRLAGDRALQPGARRVRRRRVKIRGDRRHGEWRAPSARPVAWRTCSR